ncbi:hypothetical protein cyc_09378 [Cyclospora cayetanensis]|uniref:Uncharacterized protein n=1 Tax=Cyclospora cayetanensis TaxID=88456 RepID=A0A1D3D3I1_9EIME|nr:hypothetical protein cyc_09378 [Cyclospora cayetanensis]
MANYHQASGSTTGAPADLSEEALTELQIQIPTQQAQFPAAGGEVATWLLMKTREVLLAEQHLPLLLPVRPHLILLRVYIQKPGLCMQQDLELLVVLLRILQQHYQQLELQLEQGGKTFDLETQSKQRAQIGLHCRMRRTRVCCWS